MTYDEAQMIAMVISTADNGCDNCVMSLCEEMNRVFSEFKFTMSRDATWSRRMFYDDGTLQDEDCIESFPLVLATRVEPANSEAA